MPDYIASRRITAPGQYVTAYQQGDPVSADVVSAWALDVPGDVQPADDYQAPRPAEDSSDRAAWEAYVTGQGTGLEEARAAGIDDLRALYPAPAPEPAPAWQVNDQAGSAQPVSPVVATPERTTVPGAAERPAQSAPKSEWVDWAVAAGADGDWARAKDTLKDDLMNYGQNA